MKWLVLTKVCPDFLTQWILVRAYIFVLVIVRSGFWTQSNAPHSQLSRAYLFFTRHYASFWTDGEARHGVAERLPRLPGWGPQWNVHWCTSHCAQCVFRANIWNLCDEVWISQYSLSAPNEEMETHIYAYSWLFKQKFKTHTPINLTELTLRSLLLRVEGLEFKFTAISRCLSCVLGVTLSQGGCLSQTAPSGQFLSFLGLHL